MLTKKIKYKDFLGVERTEDFVFNLTETELTQLELKTEGQLTSKLSKLSKSPDIPQLMEMFELIIEKSYGVISDDGRKLIKTKEVYDDFRFTNAYDELMKELLSSDETAAKFVNGIMPADLIAKVEAESKKAKDELGKVFTALPDSGSDA